MNEKKLSDSFVILSLHYIKQCSDKWKSDYWDDRDRASVNMCRDIVRCPEFSGFYESKCKKEPGKWELYAEEGDWHNDILLGVKLIHSIYFMHPTNRQTLSGLVLSFYANSPKMEKLSKAGHRAKGLPYHENVRFVMIKQEVCIIMFSDAVLSATEHKILAKRRFCIWFRQNISAFRYMRDEQYRRI